MYVIKRLSFRKFYLIFGLVMSLLTLSVSSIVNAQELPSMRFERSDPLTPNWATNETILQNSRTGGSATSIGSGPSYDVQELARALRYDPQKMFEYVHDNVEIHGTFGLSKGATGAAIDLNGNVFDQVHLLGQLFQEAASNGSNITVIRYRYGILTLTPTEFQAWYGISNARAACEFLGAGGFPAKVQSTTDCSTLSGALTQDIEVGHFWLTAQINGVAKVYDPAFKRHTQYASLLNLQSDMGYVSGTVSSSVGGSYTTTLAPSVINLNYTSLKTAFDTRAQQLYNYIASTHYDAYLNELLGGHEIIPFDRDIIANGATSFSSGKYSYKDVWPTIPHHMRSTVRVHLYKPGKGAQAGQDATVIDHTFFADEIAGRRLAIEPNGFIPTESSPTGLIQDCGHFPNSAEKYIFKLNLTLDGGIVPGTYISDICAPIERALFSIKIVSDLPYAQQNHTNQDGKYADREMDATIDLVTRAVVVSTWGKSGANTMNRYLLGLSSEDDAAPVAVEDFSTDDNNEPAMDFGMTKSTENTRFRLAASWLSQVGKLSELNSLVSNSYSQHHSTIGLVFARTTVDAYKSGNNGGFSGPGTFGDKPPNLSFKHNWRIKDESITLSLSNSTSITHYNSDIVKRNAAAKTLASMSATLEGSVFEQMMDSVDVGSTATKFTWANNGSEGGNTSEDGGGSDHSTYQGAFKFYGFTANSAQASNSGLWTASGRTSAGCAATGLYAPECYWGVSGPKDLVTYLDAGYSVVAPSDVYLGPGMNCGTWNSITPAGGATPAQCDPSYTRGGAYIAMKVDANGYLSDAAHVVSMPFRSAKGSGTPSLPEEISMVDAPSGADLLKEQNELSWSHNVDLKSGGLTYAPGAILTSGVGGFPYSLSYEPTFTSGETSATAPIWKHNWNFKADVSGSGMEAMGSSRPINAVPTLVALIMLNDTYANTSSNMDSKIRVETGGAFINNIWSNHLTYNVVTITQGSSTEQFVRKPWTAAQNTFTPSSQSNAVLMQTGNRTIGAPRTGVGDNGSDTTHPTTRAWRYDTLGFTLTDASQNLMSFNYWSKYHPENSVLDYQKKPGLKYGFRPSTWALKAGVNINFEYAELDSSECVAGINNLAGYGCRPVLKKVSNSLGRSLEFSYAYNPNTSVFTKNQDVTSVTDETGRSANVLVGVDGQVSQFTFRTQKRGVIIDSTNGTAKGVVRARYLDAVYNQNDISGANGAGPSSKFFYDTLGRIKEFEYPTGQNNNLKTYSKIKYHIADGRRAEVLNATNHASTTIYDEYGRTHATLNALGLRTDNTYDGLGRLVDTRRRNKIHAYHYYQLRNSYSYDEHHNKITSNTHPKTLTNGSDYSTSTLLTATSFYENPTYPNLITKSISARGNAAPTPADFAVTYEYNPKGQLTAQNGAEGERSETLYNSVGLPYSTKSLISGTVGVNAVWRESTTSFCGISDTVNCPGTGYNLPISKTLLDPAGTAGNIITTFKWDAYGNLAETTDPLGIITTADYDLARRPTEIIKDPVSSAERQTFVYEYDAIGRPKALKTSLKETGGTVSDWLVTRVTYDVNGRAGTVTDPDGDVTQFKYNTRRWLDEQIDGENRSTKYDYLASGENYCTRRAYGTTLQTTYKRNYFDYNSQPYVWSPGKSDPDTDCNVAEHQDNDPALDLYKRFRSYLGRDTYYRNTRMTFPDLTYALTYYDEDGNITKTRNRRFNDEAIQEIDTIYDKSGRILTKTTPESIYVYAYNKGGEILSTTLSGIGGGGIISSITNVYDFAGRVKSECRLDGKCTGYEYDKRGQRKSLVWPDGWTVDYTYTRSGALRQAVDDTGNVIVKYFYNRAGHVTSLYRGGASMALGAVSVTTHKFQNDGDLARQVHIFNGSANVDMRYGYDASSKLVSQYASRDEYMWSGASIASAPQTTTYQSSGNGYAGESTAGIAANDLDQYGSVDGSALLYDGRGNTVAYGTTLFLHNSENQLKSVSGTNASGAYTQSYQYDPLGRRRFTQTATAGNPLTSTGFVHAGDMEIAELDSTGNIIRRYVPGTGTDNRIVMINVDPTGGGMGTETDRYYYVADRLGSVIAMVNTVGVVVDRYVYSPYGVEDQLTGSGNPFRYTGRKYDPLTGIYHYRARYYHQGLGRFLETDPVGYSDQMNLYGYVGNDPLNATDPTGMYVEIELHDGNLVKFIVPIQFVGLPMSNEQKSFATYGLRAWAGSHGKYNVTVSIRGRNNLSGRTNSYEFSALTGRAHVSGHNRAKLFSNSMSERTVTHEAGHILGLPDKYVDIVENGVVVGVRAIVGTDGATNIMGMGTNMTEDDITNIINASTNVVNDQRSKGSKEDIGRDKWDISTCSSYATRIKRRYC